MQADMAFKIVHLIRYQCVSSSVQSHRLPVCLSNINLFDVIFVNYPVHAHLLFHYNVDLVIYQIRCGPLMQSFASYQMNSSNNAKPLQITFINNDLRILFSFKM